MIESDIFPIPAFKDNYIWTWIDKASKTAWVVDPGEAAPVIKLLNEQELGLAGILITHHHSDHTGGVGELLQHWKDIPVVGSYKSAIKHINRPVRQGDEIICPPYHFKTIEIPGHTLDHTAYYNADILFSGDTLFSAGCGRVFEGTPVMMYESLEKLKRLPDKTKLYCGHEYTLANLNFAQLVEPNNPHIEIKIRAVQLVRGMNKPSLPSTMHEERLINPFLRCLEPDVIRAVEHHVGIQIKDPIEVFAHLRSWKNSL